MRSAIFLALGLFLILCLFWLWPAPPSAAQATERDPIEILQSADDGLLLRVQAPSAVIEPLLEAPQYHQLRVIGAVYVEQPGHPQLPFFVTTVALPAHAVVSAEVVRSDCRRLPGLILPAPAPTWELTKHGPDFVASVQQEGPDWIIARHEDAAIYHSSESFPARLVAVGAPQVMRGRRLAQVRFYPWQVIPAARSVRYCHEFDVKLRFSSSTPFSPLQQDQSSGFFDALFERSVINWSRARDWPLELSPPDLPGEPWQSGLRIVASSEGGMHRLTYAELEAAGVPVASLDPRTLRLFHRENETAIEVVGEADGVFDPTDEIRFYVAPTHNRYTLHSFFWLRWGGASGERMATVDATPSGSTPVTNVYTRTAHLEQQQRYRSELPIGKDEDHWVYTEIYPRPGMTTDIKNYPFTTTDADVQPGVSVTARFMGGQQQSPNPDHWVRLWLNGQAVGSYSWDGQIVYTATAFLANSTLLTTTNTLTVEASLNQVPDVLAYWVIPDWYDIEYVARLQAVNGRLDVEQAPAGRVTYSTTHFSVADVFAYDVSQPLQPQRLTGLTAQEVGGFFEVQFESEGERFYLNEPTAFLAPVSLTLVGGDDLHANSQGADYIAIGPAGFLAAAQPLLATHQAAGLRVATVDIQAIFDQFAGGYPEPQAIRDFLAYAYAYWQRPAPSFVLLIGDGHYDFRDDLGYHFPNPVPPYLIPVDPWIGETVSDNSLASVDGPDDFLPDLHIGRLPVNSVVEVQNVLAKFDQYISAPPGPWQSAAIYTADRQPDPAGAGNFHDLSDEARLNWLTSDMVSQRVYVGTQPYAYPDGPSANAALLNAWSGGALFTQWFGHGSQFRWSRVGADRVLSTLQEATFPPQIRLPFVAEWGCWTGYFIVINPPGSTLPHSLGETLLKTPGKGAIADIAATGLHTAFPLQVMTHGLHELLFTERVSQAGVAYTAMKLFYFGHSGGGTDVLETTVFFGDPALALRLPEGDLSASSAHISAPLIQPGESLTVTATVTNSSIFTLTQPNVAAAFPSLLLTSVSANGGVVSDGQIVWTLADLAPGASQSVAAVLTATTAITPGSYPITIPLQLGSRMAPTVTLTLTSALQATADLTPSSLTADRAWAAPGQAVTFTLVISNAGNMTSPQTWLTATLPASLAAPLWLTATAPTAFYDDASRQVRWQGPAAPVSPVTVSFSSVISSTLSACGAISLPADLTDAWGNTLGRTAAVNLAVPDVNCDGVVNIIDVQSVALRFGALPGDPWYDPHYDLDADGVIGILDIMLVASRWQAAPAG